MIILKISIADNVVESLKKEAQERKVSITKRAYQIIKEHFQIDKEEDK